MLYVTHDQIEAMSLADRIIVLDRGHVLQVGTPDDIYRQPVSPRVAQMLGTPPINLLRADQAAAVFRGFALPASGAARTIGVRPEHVALAPDPTGAVTVRVVEHLGPITVAYFAAPGGGDEVDVRAALAPTAAIAVGERFTLTVLPANILTWDS